MRKLVLAWALPGLLLPAVASAGTKDFASQGFALPPGKAVTIALMRPDVDVGELQAGGLPQPNADWTKQARDNLEVAFRDELAARKIDFRTMEAQLALRAREAAELQQRCDAARTAQDQARASAAAAEAAAKAALAAQAAQAAAAAKPAKKGAAPLVTPPAAPTVQPAAVVIPEVPAECSAPPPAQSGEELVAEYNALHGAVVQAILQHKYGYGGGKLPTKKQDFDYTLGPGTAALARLSGANYGLFVQTYDQFASASRKTMQVAGLLGCAVGFCMIVSGGVHVAYVSLVDLDTGKLAWFNLVRGSQGDIREPAGAHGLATAILASLPTQPAPAKPAK